MIAKAISIALIAVFQPQQSNSPFYVESWKKGNQQIQEQNFMADVDANKPEFEVKVKDASGKENYKLTLQIWLTKDGSPYTYGYISLVEKGLVGFKGTNLLKPSNDPYQDYFTGKDYVDLFDPLMQGERCKIEDGCSPFWAKRIVKVKGFYCIFQVTDYKRGDGKSLGSMTVHIEFTNRYDNQ